VVILKNSKFMWKIPNLETWRKLISDMVEVQRGKPDRKPWRLESLIQKQGRVSGPDTTVLTQDQRPKRDIGLAGSG